MLDLEVISTKLQRPTGLSLAQFLWLHESSEIIMVRQDPDWIGTSFQVVPPLLERCDDGEYFLIVRLIILLGWDHLP